MSSGSLEIIVMADPRYLSDVDKEKTLFKLESKTFRQMFGDFPSRYGLEDLRWFGFVLH